LPSGASFRDRLGWSTSVPGTRFGTVVTPSCGMTVERERAMPTYIAFGAWTEQGMRAIGDSPNRLDAAKRELEDMGGRFIAFWMTLGEHDMVLVYETPDDAVAARFSLMLNRLGAVRTRTLKAFPEAAYRQVVASLK